MFGMRNEQEVTFGYMRFSYLVFSERGAGASAQKIIAEIDVPKQIMIIKRFGQMLYNWKVSTGRNGYKTPGGVYRPQRMYKIWYSKKYNNTPMLYAVFFDRGYAIHGTNAVGHLGSPASHGCVHLATGNAQALYNLVNKIGTDNIEIVIRN